MRQKIAWCAPACRVTTRGNDLRLREPDEDDRARHWILEIHCVDRSRMIGGLFEELLTLEAAIGAGG